MLIVVGYNDDHGIDTVVVVRPVVCYLFSFSKENCCHTRLTTKKKKSLTKRSTTLRMRQQFLPPDTTPLSYH